MPPPPRPAQLLGLDAMSAAERKQVERQAVIRDFQRHPGDVGSPQVMGEGGLSSLLCMHALQVAYGVRRLLRRLAWPCCGIAPINRPRGSWGVSWPMCGPAWLARARSSCPCPSANCCY